MNKPKHSLKEKITSKFLLYSISVIFTFLVVVSVLQFSALKLQMENALSTEAKSILRLLENRLGFLTEKAKNFSQNSFVKNSLIDAEGRKVYLPQLIKDFSSTAGLSSVSVVNFSGKVIQSSNSKVRHFQEDIRIRPALETGQDLIWLDLESKNIIIVSPIVFYETPQGAVISEFRIKDIVNHVFIEGSNTYYKIFSNSKLIQAQGFDQNIGYTSTRTFGGKELPIVNGLKIELEMGQSNSYFYGPIQKVILRLSLLSILIVAFAIYMAKKFGNSLSRPILDLCEKVTSKNTLNTRCSPVGTDDELELLAEKLDLQTDNLIQSKLELEDRVEQRTNELSRTNQSLKNEIEHRKQIEIDLKKARIISENANQSKSLFLANMSHEIRTPLNAILGYSQILNRDSTLTNEQKKSILTIFNSGNTLLGLINEILDISKIEAGKMELNLIEFDLNELVMDMFNLFEQTFQKKGLGWEVNYPHDGQMFVRGDAGKLRQVLTNLISNAVKFTDSGAVQFLVSPGNGDRVNFLVKDTGKGIPQDDQNLIFEPFRQGKEGNKKGGTGLGLAISRSQIELMGGTLKLDSELGQGATFSFSIALPEASGEGVLQNNKSQVLRISKGHHIKAIIADDIGENLDILSKVLTDIGVETERAVNGKEVLEKIKRDVPDIIFMDKRMPELDGIQAAKQIIEEFGPDRIKLIAVTASALEHEREKFCSVGFHDFIIKPFLIEKIFQCLENHLNIEFDYKVEPKANCEGSNKIDFSRMEHALTKDQIIHLRKSAEIGNITEIENSLTEISQENEKNQNLVKEMSGYISEYDMEGFLNFLGVIDHADKQL